MIEEVLEHMFDTSYQNVVDVCNMLVFIDIGVIESTRGDNVVTVRSCKKVAGETVVYTNIELIGIGNRRGGFVSGTVGSACLIFVPRSNVPNTRDLYIRPGTSAFDKSGAKALPITNGCSLDVNVAIADDGSLHLSSDKHNLVFSKDSFSYQHGRIGVGINKDEELFFFKSSQNKSTFSVQASDNGVLATYTTKKGTDTLTYTIDMNETNHTLEIKQKKGDTEKASIVIDTDGNICLNGDEKTLVTYKALNDALQSMWSSIKSHTHPVSVIGEAGPYPIAISTTATSATWSSDLDISDAEATTIKTS